MIHLPNLIVDLALILGAAALVTLIFKKLKQPLVLGYIIAGVLVGPNFTVFPTITDFKSINIWAELGVIFLLFSLGLEFSFKKLIKVGGSSSITAIVEIVFMLLAGYFAGRLMGWSNIDSIFLGGILSISSTTIIIRAFDELGVKSQKYAGLVFGVLIVEDLVAILLLVLLSTLALSNQFAGTEMVISLLKLIFFLALWFLSGIFLLPTFLKWTRKLMNDETMLIAALALCLLMVLLAVKVGFSPALGAFIMGSILAETIYAEKIEHLTASVKNLFGAIFFVSVGMLIDPAMLVQYFVPIVIITLVTIFGKTISTTVGAIISGQPLKQAVKAGMSLAQIGEFSFIIATLGVTLKVTSDFLYPVAVAVSAVTTFSTPYMIRFSEPFYNFLERKLPAKWISNLNRYSSSTQTLKNTGAFKDVLYAYGLNIIINSVIIIAVIILSSRYMAPFISAEIEDKTWSAISIALITFLLMAPFLWALSAKRISKKAQYNLWLNQKLNRGPLIMLEIFRIALAIFYVGFLVDQLFSARTAFFVVLPALLITFFIFSRRLQNFYDIIEQRFLNNLNARQLENGNKSAAVMVPWDAHLVEFELQPESSFIGKTLQELTLREKFGINIAMIERGKIRINIPNRNERLFPGDTIAVIGTDEQLEQFKKAMDLSLSPLSEPFRNLEVSLQQFTVKADSPLIGKNIRESGIRENTHGLIVGIERNNLRILNPDSLTTFLIGDVVWIVGEEKIAKDLR